MFTWFQNTFHKHHKFVLGFLLFLMVASFVLYGYVGQPSGMSLKRTVYRGVNLADSHETRDARDLAAFGSLFRDGRERTPADFDSIIKSAIANGEKVSSGSEYASVLGFIDRIRTADEAGVPHPDDASIRAYIESASWLREDDKFSPKRLQTYADRARELGIDDARLQGVMAQLWRLEKVGSVLTPDAAPGLDVLSGRLVAKHNAKWTVETAAFAAADFKLPAAPTDKELEAYFAKNKETYRVPAKLRVGVIKVEGVPAAAPASPSDAELLDTLRRHVASFPESELPKTREALPPFLKDNRTKLAGMMVADKAGEEAAMKLTRKLDELLPRTAGKPDAVKLATILKTGGLTLTPIPAFSAQELPKNTGIPDAQLSGALQLSGTNWRTYVSADGLTAYAFVYDSTIPERDATFAEARDKVLRDYTTEETRTRFLEAGRTKALEITAAVKAGKNFADAAKTAGFKPAPAVTFDYAKAPAGFDARTLDVLENVPVGGVSGALSSGADIFVARIISRAEPPATRDAAELATERDELGALAARATYGSLRAAEGL